MNWVVDAQLPRRLAKRLTELGHHAIHTLDLPQGNRTTDADLCRVADASERVLVSKDRDFFDSYIVNGTPRMLLWVTLGNVSNTSLIEQFEEQIGQIEELFSESNCIELTASGLIVHR